MFVGIADTFTVSFSSEADVSGVSLVTLFNTVLIFLFTVLTTGGAVISQYIGSKREEDASRTSGQLFMISAVVPLALTVLIVACRVLLLRLLFGRIEADVMSAAKPIFSSQRFLCRSFLAVYNAGTAFCRSIGKTNVTMYVHFRCGKRHQRCQKLRRRFCPSNGCGGRCLSFIDFRYSLRRGFVINCSGSRIRCISG